MLNSIGVKVNATQLQEIITEVIGDEPRIDFNAFVLLMTRKYKQISFDEEIEQLFNLIDLSHDNIIDSNDLNQLLKNQNINFSNGEIESLISTLSDSPNGINKEEFKEFIKNLGAITIK